MYRFLISTLGLILMMVTSGCQNSTPKSSDTHSCKVVKINIGDEPQTLDPRKARDLACQTIARMLFEGLSRVNAQEKTELALAESVEISSDLKTYTFHLKESIWSNGDPVKASDFAYAWKKMLSTDFPSDTAFHLYVVKNAKAAKEGKVSVDTIGVVAKDERTLVVELENPTPYFLELTTFPAFFPIHQKLEESNPSWAINADTYVGNGPFQLTDWKHQDHLKLKKNEKYWDAQTVQLSALELMMVQGETELKMYEKNALDWAGSPLSTLPVDALAPLKDNHTLLTKEMLGTYFIRANTERAPLGQSKMRQAFAMAIDRQAIIDHVTQGNQIPATGLVPISLGLQQAPYFQDGNQEAAKSLFAEALSAAKLTKETLPELSLMYRAGERNHLIAQALQQQWFEAFGIRVKLESIEGKVYFDRISKQDYQLASGNWIADFADPINFLEVFKYKNGGSNNTCWENAHYIERLDRSSQVADPLQRTQLLAECEKILMNEMPIIPLFYYTMLYVNQPYLKDVVLSSMGQIDFKWAKIDKENQEIVQRDEK